MAGVHPKVVQTVMRHSPITLTMDTYANLFKGQEADAVAKMRDMMISDQPEVIRATGTDDRIILKDGGDQSACAARETWHTGAKCCDGQSPPPAQEESLKPVQIADLSDVVRDDALASESAP